MTAISASTHTYRSLVDNTLVLVVHIQPRYSKQAVELFGQNGTELAIVAIKPNAQQEQAKPKGGPASQWLALRCKEAAFRMWLSAAHKKAWQYARLNTSVDPPNGAAVAAAVVRTVCQVQSRADIDNDEAAFQRFETLIRRPYLEATRDG